MFIGVDWGGTKIAVAALTTDGEERVRLREDTPRGDYDACLATIADLVARTETEVGTVDRVGIGIPGSIDPTTGLAKGASSTWLIGRPVEQDLRRVLGKAVRLENDVDTMVAAEARDGAGAGYRTVFAVNLASGVGGAVAVDGVVHHGPNNNAGDWGHMPLPWASEAELEGAACWCGLQGCIETMLSGRAFEAQYEAATGTWRHGSDVAALARSGDPVAAGVLDDYIDRLARGMAVLVNVMDPDVFVMVGGMSNVDELYERLPEMIPGFTFTDVFVTPILKAVHGESSGVRGAAWLWAEEG